MTNLRKAGIVFTLLTFAGSGAASAFAQASPAGIGAPPAAAPDATSTKEESSVTDHTISVGGKSISYHATAGTIQLKNAAGEATALMYYTAYTKSDVKEMSQRPIAFLYNGGPGSSSVWLHMGAFGPRRVVTKDDSHTPAAPYQLVNNDYSLLDASDLVFIDAPGAGFSRLIANDADASKRDEQMKDRRKEIYGVDGDGHAFAQFITQFLSRYSRWNSPKYLFGESYGTTRSAVVANDLENENSVDLNGVILLSQILNFDTSIDGPDQNPGVDLPYELALPTYAATAYYHHKLPQQPADLESLLQEVEQFALGDYAQAL
ncbi:MAG TPA: hypothetical protein VIH72_05240, partial [Candidatus Acidoferrales bacterium]